MQMPELLDRFQHIAIEGAIGVGKTTLAQKMAAHLNANLVLEEFGNNPFLERFYKTNRQHALSTQLFFFYQRLDQLQALGPNLATSRTIADYIFEKNSVFADVTLNEEEQLLYQRACSGLYPTAWPAPDLVIWLQAEPITLISRIAKRGRQNERNLDEQYLGQLNEAYTKILQDYNHAPVFAINTQTFNPVDNEEHFSVLLEKLESFRGAREYFNPQV